MVKPVPTPAPRAPVAAPAEPAVEIPAAVVPEAAAEIAPVAAPAASSAVAAQAPAEPSFKGPDTILAELPAESAAERPTELGLEVPPAVAAAVPTELPAEGVAEVVAEAPTDLVFDFPAEAAAELPAELLIELAADVPAAVPTELPTEVVAAAPIELAFDFPAEVVAELPAEVVADVSPAAAAAVPTALELEVPPAAAAELPTEPAFDIPAAAAAELAAEVDAEAATAIAAEVPAEAAVATPTEPAAEVPTKLAAEVPTKLAAKAPAAIAASVAASVAAKLVSRAGGKAGGKAVVRTAGPRRSLFSLGKKTHVGVDISQSELVCVKILGHDAGFEVLATEVTPIPAGVEPGSQAFIELLGRALKAVCGPGPIPSIWAATQSARANLQFLTIPKVASRQVDNAVFWTAKKEMGFDEAGVVFDFERRGEVAEKGATRLGAMAYTTPRDAVAVIRNDFAKAGFPLAGLTLEPFAHQNLFRRRVLTEGAAGAVANLHVGQHWSRLEIFSNGNLMFVRVIKTSMSGMEQAVLESLESRGAVSPSAPPAPAGRSTSPVPPGPREEMVLDLDALGPHDTGLILELDPVPEPPKVAPEPQPAEPSRATVAAEPAHARELVEAVIYGCMPEEECHPGSGLAVEDVMEMLRPVASRLVRQVEMTIKHYRESLGHEPVSRLTVSGVLGGSALFIEFIRDNIGLPCMPLDILSGRRLPPNLTLGRTLPSTLFTQALGLALSDSATTPSVFVTYKDRAAVHTSRLLEQWSLVGLAAVLAGMALFFFAAASERQGLEKEHDALARQLAAFGSGLDASVMSHKAQELRGKVEAMRRYISRNQIVGVWEEALALAPEGVRLGTLTAECGPVEKPANPANPAKPAGQPAPGGKDPNAPVSRLVVEGVVTGDSRLFDSMLASYVVALEGSPLFEDVSVKRNELESLENGATALRFVVTLNLSEVRP
ncbi:putative Fe-S oxidoreductase [Desulfovibrio sp. DV]|uniref:hypothetical protein n=1 Tax=Desulfovibrio sp. DV TaxID=1844708 RepID=UPI0009626F18|nr:hypothetical protein [Desulfovibrio sp. DV]OLN28470.1 putative Fe-S oxidoreductase [Desulfovibrio sp. DV]